MSQIPDKIVQQLKTCASFATPSAASATIIALARDPGIDLSRVAETVSADPAIAARIMQIANSAMYARRRQSTNLRQALIVLGLRATLTIAMSITLVSSLRRDPSKGFDLDAFWKRAILAATWGKVLANEFGRRDAEEVFLAALLQDIGMLALDKVAPEVYAGIAPFQLEHTRVCQHEQSCIETEHRSVGDWLLKSWQLPEIIVQGVQNSHDASGGGVDPEHREFVRCVALSGELADVWLTGQGETAIRWAGVQVHRYLGILPNRLADLFTLIKELIPVTEGLFDVQVIPADQTRDIVDLARKILMVRNLHTLADLQQDQSAASGITDKISAPKVATERDSLTGVYNRREFEDAVEREFVAAVRNRWPLSVVLIDLDHFQAVNDAHGHQGGDAMLKEVATQLAATLRESDVVARYGGDEFVLLLPGLDSPQVAAVAARLVQEIRGRKVIGGSGKQFSITLSLGIATCDSKSVFTSSRNLLAAAEAALQHSKRSGRDQHTCYENIRAA